jgi:hypothetical protein
LTPPSTSPSDQYDISKELIQQAGEKYSEITALRAAVQLIPFIGGSLDTLVGGEGQKIQQRRIAHFIDELDRRLKSVETPKRALANEDLFDLMVGSFEQVAKARSEEKRARFAQIVANEVVHAKRLEDAITAIRLIAELDDLHIHVLDIAVQAQLRPSTSNKLLAISIANTNFIAPIIDSNLVLVKVFPDIPEYMLRLVCSELISKGLLSDEGAGQRIGAGNMEYFAATNLAAWLFTWLKCN